MPYHLAWTLLCDLLDYFDGRDTAAQLARWTERLVSEDIVEVLAAHVYIYVAGGDKVQSPSLEQNREAHDVLVSGSLQEATGVLEYFSPGSQIPIWEPNLS